jgi:hypothetical protein
VPSINSSAGGKYWWSALIWPGVLGQQFGEISNLHFARSSGMKLHLLEAELVAWGLSAKMCVDHEGIEVARIRVGLIEHLIKSVPQALSTPEQKCIGWPEQKYISDASRKAPETGVFCSGIRLGSDYLPTYPR